MLLEIDVYMYVCEPIYECELHIFLRQVVLKGIKNKIVKFVLHIILICTISLIEDT